MSFVFYACPLGGWSDSSLQAMRSVFKGVRCLSEGGGVLNGAWLDCMYANQLSAHDASSMSHLLRISYFQSTDKAVSAVPDLKLAPATLTFEWNQSSG